MEWDDLKSFLAVARSGSLSEAARLLKTSAATVGRRISSLEQALNVQLFHRGPNGYALTDCGRAISLKAEQAENAVLSIERTALGRDVRTAGKVRVATTEDIGTLVIAPALAHLHEAFPGIHLDLVAGQDVVNLTRREADIALRPVRATKGNYVIRQVGWWECTLYAAKTYVEAHRLEPGKKDWLSRVSIIRWTDERMNLLGGPWLAEHARGSSVALASNTRRIHLAACKAGVGVAILPCVAAEHDPDLVRLLPPREVASLPLWLLAHRDLARTARVKAVMAFLADAAAKACGRRLD
jgi:DNA-binding transcriptional LysR family regulator